MKFFHIFIVTLFLAGIFSGCINIDANTKVDGADKYSAIGEKYADKYAGTETENHANDKSDD